MRRAKVVISDRYPVVIEGLKKLLEADPAFELVASCRDSTSCISAVRKYAPDILIFDISMPGITPSELRAIIDVEKLLTRIVLFVSPDAFDQFKDFKSGNSYIVIPKHTSSETLLRELRNAAGTYARPRLPLSDQGIRARNTLDQRTLATLTERELQIVRLVSEGLSNKEIGRRLQVTKGTIKVHLHHIFQKLEITNRTVLAALAYYSDDRSVNTANGQLPPTHSE